MRASEAERDAVAAELREHAAVGRLDVDELEQRVGAAFAAHTREELAALRDDLPTLPHSELGEHARVFFAVQLLLVAIWAVTGGGYFWPVWPFLGWGIGLMVHALCEMGTPTVWEYGMKRAPRRRVTGSS